MWTVPTKDCVSSIRITTSEALTRGGKVNGIWQLFLIEWWQRYQINRNYCWGIKLLKSLITTGLNCSSAGKSAIKAALPIEVVPESERWRLGLLDILLSERSALEKEGKDVKNVVAMLSSLCNTWVIQLNWSDVVISFMKLMQYCPSLFVLLWNVVTLWIPLPPTGC